MLTSSLGLLTTASKSKDGSYAYNSATVPFLAEALKLTVSMYLLRSQQRTNPEVDILGFTVELFESFSYMRPGWNSQFSTILCDHMQAARMTRTWQSVLLFPIPSIIYWVHNNVQVCGCCCRFKMAFIQALPCSTSSIMLAFSS